MFLIFDFVLAVTPLIIHFAYFQSLAATLQGAARDLLLAAGYLNWLGNFLLYGSAFVLAQFLEQLDRYGSQLVSIYYEINLWMVLVGGGLFQLMLFFIWIAAAEAVQQTDAELVGPWIYFGIYAGVTTGLYVGYGLCWQGMN